MDDLKELRDYGRTLEHEPPATLARQRERLLRAAAGRSRRRMSGWLAAALVAVVTAATVAAVAVLTVPTLLFGDRHTANMPAGQRPAKVTGALNILLVGVDKGFAPRVPDYPVRTDLIMLLHLPADRKQVRAVAIPRDSIVEVPACGSAPVGADLIGSAYAKGGLTCTVKTVESATGVRVDHMAEVDFGGFARLVDALDGVEVTLPRPVDDRKAKLRLPAGKHVLNGEQAVAYMRLRNYGDGSDISRIKRQQVLIASLAKKAAKVLGDPAALREFVTVLKRSVTTDAELDAERLLGIAASLKGTRVDLVTVPWMPHPQDRNRIAWKQPDADELFASLR
jgi:LCP family protein required for cell wall assembly